MLTLVIVLAQVVAHEPFDYKEGSALDGAEGGTGWKGGWSGNGKAGCSVSAAGTCLLDGSDTRLFRRLDAERKEVAALVEEGKSGKTFGKDGTTLWIAFTIACTSHPKLAHGGLHLMDGIGEGFYKNYQRIQLGRQNKGETWFLGRVDQGGPAAGTWYGTVASDRTARRLVYRFDFKAGPEEGWMWVDPPAGRDPESSKADLHAEKIADFRFNAVNLGSGGGATFTFADLRIAATFADASPSSK